MKTPYESLPNKAFWKLAAANLNMFDISEIWDPKFNIEKNQNIVTFGSCFAQHIGNSLKQRGFKWLSTETPPDGLSEENARNFNYNIFSARTGNIYTTTLLQQWTEWALGKNPIPHEVWESNGRYYDPFRPRIEPNGFASPYEVRLSLKQAAISFKESIKNADFFIFTLGLTERWINIELNYEYPICPGVVAGKFNPDKHKFENQQFHQVILALDESIQLMREVSPKLKFILTVSPVPLTATNSNQHILVATMSSKSTLRAVTSQLFISSKYIDYFPSYEIINSPFFKGVFFEPNQRNVSTYGVNFVMENFFKCLDGKFGKNEGQNSLQKGNSKIIDTVCEEELLEAFRK